jgi:hypothetical protein
MSKKIPKQWLSAKSLRMQTRAQTRLDYGDLSLE